MFVIFQILLIKLFVFLSSLGNYCPELMNWLICVGKSNVCGQQICSMGNCTLVNACGLSP